MVEISLLIFPLNDMPVLLYISIEMGQVLLVLFELSTLWKLLNSIKTFNKPINAS